MLRFLRSNEFDKVCTTIGRVKDEDMQWALQLSEHLINLEYKISETNKLKSKALFYEGIRSSNPNKRNYFLTVAMELDPGFKGFPEVVRSESLVNEINIDTIFSMLSVSLDPDTFEGRTGSTRIEAQA